MTTKHTVEVNNQKKKREEMTSVQEQHKFKRQSLQIQLILFIIINLVFSIGIYAQINGIYFYLTNKLEYFRKSNGLYLILVTVLKSSFKKINEHTVIFTDNTVIADLNF